MNDIDIGVDREYLYLGNELRFSSLPSEVTGGGGMEPTVPSTPAPQQAPPAPQGNTVGAAKDGIAGVMRARLMARRKKSTGPKTPEEILKAKQRAEKRALRRAQATPAASKCSDSPFDSTYY